MDTGEYETNTLLINNVSSIAYRLYEPSSNLSQNFASVALEIENSLREKGHIVLYDATKKALWHFQFLPKDENSDDLGDSLELPPDVTGYGLALREHGVIEPPIIQKPRSQGLQSSGTPTGLLSTASALEQAHRPTLSSPLQTTAPITQDPDSKAEKSKTTSTAQRALYEKFIASVLLTISTTFCRRVGAVPLNYRTVILSPTAYDAQPHGVAIGRPQILGTFRAYLTTTGALMISLALSKCRGILSLDDTVPSSLAPSGYSVLAAPFGIMTATQNFVPGDGGLTSLAQTPMTQFFNFRGGLDGQESLWKQACLRFLNFRGIAASTLGGCLWVNLLVPKPKNPDTRGDQRSSGASSSFTLPWPRRLCFRKKNVDASSTSRVVDTVLSGHEESHDPLGNAKGWHASITEREEKVKRALERAANLPKDPQPQNTESKTTPKPSGLSPVALQRPNTATAGIMYPTPPDGVHQPNGVTPSIDGTLSSPGNPLSVPVIAEADAVQNEPAGGDSVDQSPEFADSKRHRSDSNVLGDGDTVFGGEIGGDMFDDNDITEADFNFFDEKPDDMDADLPMADLSSSEMALPPPPQAVEETVIPVETTPLPLAPTPTSLPLHPPATPSAPTPAQAATPAPAPAPIPSLPPPTSTSLLPPPLPPPQSERVVFAKPELKHARSQNEDPARRSRGEIRVTPAKRESSPFDPHAVFKRVKASLKMPKYDSTTSSQPTLRKAKIFESLDFDPALPMINKKYEQGGLFDLSALSKVEKMERPSIDLRAVPETDYLKRHGKLSKRQRDRPITRSTMAKQYSALEPQMSTTSPMKLDGSISGEDSSAESDQDDSSYTSDEPGSPHKASIRILNADDDILSQITSLRDCDIEEPDHQLAMELPRLSKSDMTGVPLSALFSDPEPLLLDMALNDDDLVQIAQIVTEQAATGGLDIFRASDFEAPTLSASQKRQELLTHSRDAFHTLEDIIAQFFGDTMPMRLKGLLDIQDIPLLSQFQPRQIPGREGNPEAMRPSNLYQIPSPHLEVQRADTKLSVLPSAVSFWESLGLSPSSGSKNINALCVYPGWPGMGDNVQTFLDRIKSVYEFLKLGTFEVMPLGADMEPGLLPYEIDRITTSPDATVTGHGSAMIESMEVLRGIFTNLAITETNFVIYFVYSPDNPGTIIESCTAFQRFFETYQRILATRKEPPQNELVLQLVSADLLSSPSALVVTPTSDLVRLCIETYDRCTLFGGPMPAPAIRLEQLLPRIIDFKLTTNPSASLIRENSCIHVAYAQSVDERWITAAWTDDRGNQQATASYCMGRKGKQPSRNMNEIANEIWETTLELISAWKVLWRVIITKCGPMPQHEMDFWVDLARTEINAKVTVALLTVDTNPSLQLLPPVVKLAPPSAALHTPASTPLPSAFSPEPPTPATPARESMAVATPSGDGGASNAGAADADLDAILTDVTDQTWGAIAGHRLSNSTSILEVHPALISGYLIKRTGIKVEDAPIVMEVNLVYTEAMPRVHEPLFREMLGYFRGLGTLARARGVVDREADVRPWHVAAAEKAARALYLCNERRWKTILLGVLFDVGVGNGLAEVVVSFPILRVIEGGGKQTTNVDFLFSICISIRVGDDDYGL